MGLLSLLALTNAQLTTTKTGTATSTIKLPSYLSSVANLTNTVFFGGVNPTATIVSDSRDYDLSEGNCPFPTPGVSQTGCRRSSSHNAATFTIQSSSIYHFRYNHTDFQNTTTFVTYDATADVDKNALTLNGTSIVGTVTSTTSAFTIALSLVDVAVKSGDALFSPSTAAASSSKTGVAGRVSVGGYSQVSSAVVGIMVVFMAVPGVLMLAL